MLAVLYETTVCRKTLFRTFVPWRKLVQPAEEGCQSFGIGLFHQIPLLEALLYGS